MQKSILIVGLGRFGRHMAYKFFQQGNDVMGVDSNEERVNEAMPFLTNAQIGDSTNEHFIASLGVRNFDLCVVAIGDNFQSSLETTALLKDMGAKFILSRASRDVHAKFLLRNGADQVVYTEKEMAERLAVIHGLDSVFDYIKLSPEYSIYEVQVPHHWVGKNVIQLSVRSKYNINVLAIKEKGHIRPLSDPNHVFVEQETLLVMGHNDDVAKMLGLKEGVL